MARPPQAHEDICAHKPCDCSVEADKKYCSEACAEAAKNGRDDCPCDCGPCPDEEDQV